MRIEYAPPGPVIARFMQSTAFVRGIKGPIGSGKSTACIMDILAHAAEQPRGPNGKRQSRWAAIRNTYPELSTTTIRSWHQWVPQHVGRWVGQGPPRHHIDIGDLDLEVMFLALDRPDDIGRLLSLELTGAWINEAREIPKSVLDAVRGRVGRFPAKKDGGAGWFGVTMDTNPPDTDHWWYNLAEEDRPDGYEFFSQPSGLDPAAENIENLPHDYYARLLAGTSKQWQDVYVRGRYGFVQDGKPVVPEYKDDVHCREFELSPKVPISIGIDFGLTPAAIVGQRSAMGQVRWRYEITTERMGAVAFAAEINRWLNGPLADFEIENIHGDPAGDAAAQTDETTPFQILKAAGIDARPARTNDFSIRREAVAQPMLRMVDGEPGFLIHPDCKMARKGLQGAYRYKRVMVTGDERFHDKPDKNQYSHPCEAGQYLNLAFGEGAAVVRRTQTSRQPPISFPTSIWD